MKLWKRVGAGIVILVVLLFFGYRLYQNWAELSIYDFTVSPWLLILSLPFLLFGFISFSLGWRTILNSLGENISVRDAIRIFCVSELAKYVPGSIWAAVGKISMVKKKDVALVSAGLDTSFKVGGALLVAVVFVSPLFPDYFGPVIALVLLALILTVIHPRVLGGFVKIANRLIGKRINRRIKLKEFNYWQLFSGLLFYALAWLSFGVGFSIFATAFEPMLGKIFFLIGLFSLAWVIGFLAVPFPAGIGIREGILVIGLTMMLIEPVAIVIALAARLWWSVGDGLVFSTGMVLQKTR